jgi:hypothetical protein
LYEDALAPGSVVLIGGRYWLVDRIEQALVQTQPAQRPLTTGCRAADHPSFLGHLSVREPGPGAQYKRCIPDPIEEESVR